MRSREPGWVLIGQLDQSGRHGLWLRRTPAALELCAGLEGDYAHVKILEGEPIRAQLLDDIAGLLEVYDFFGPTYDPGRVTRKRRAPFDTPAPPAATVVNECGYCGTAIIDDAIDFHVDGKCVDALVQPEGPPK